jgi:hypothetical protein
MPTLEEIEFAFEQAHEAGDTENAAILADYVREERARIATESENPFDSISDWDEFKFGWDRTDSDIGNWYTWLESRMPTVVGLNPSTYSDEFLAASPEERLQALNNEKEMKLQEEYPELYALAQQGKTSGWTTTGDIVGALATPTTLAPIGGVKYGVKGAIALGGLLSSQYTLSEQLVSGEDINPTELAVSAGLGGLVSGGVYKVGQVIAKRGQKKLVTAANNSVDEMNLEAAKAVANDVPDEEIANVVKQNLNLTDEQVKSRLTLSERKFNIPNNKEEAQVLLKTTEEVTDSGKQYKKGTWAADFFSTISDRLGYIDKGLKMSLRRYDMQSQISKHTKLKQAEPFMRAVDNLDDADKAQLGLHLKNGDYDAAQGIVGKNGDIKTGRGGKGKTYTPQEAVSMMRNVLEDTAQELEGVGVTVNRIENYFPRVVKDYDAMMDSLGKPVKGRIEQQLARGAKALGKTVDDLTESQREDIINNTLSGHAVSSAGGGKLKFTRNRSINQVTSELQTFYKGDIEALEEYIVRSVDKIEEVKFFKNTGTGAKLTEDGFNIDYDKSIGSTVNKLLQSDGISNAAQSDIVKLLKARFEAPKLTPNKFFQKFRTGNYAFTIGNPFSALVQLQDLGLSTVTQGLMPTISSLFGRKVFTIDDFALDNYIISELSTVGDYSRGLHKLLGLSGFRRVDRLGKETLMNAAFKNGKRLAKKNDPRLASKYKKAFGNEYDSLVKELEQGQITERTKMYVFSELADAQPISLSEVPLQYAKMSNGRLFYMLKTFGLRQLGLIRNNTVETWKEGRKLEAMKNAALFATIPPVIGAGVEEVEDLILGEGFDVNDLPDQYVNKLLAMGFASKYGIEQLSFGKAGNQIAEMIAPPAVTYSVVIEDLANAIGYAATGEEPDEQLLENTMKKAPLLGKFLEAFFYGGLEKRQAAENKKDYNL